MTRPEELLSVVIATRNRCRSLTTCLDSLAGCRFDRHRFEVLIVDNGSQDATPQMLQEESRRGRLPLRSVSEPRPGKALALNAGIRAARGDDLVFLDDDELVAPQWLEAFDRHLRVEQCPIVQGRIFVRFLGPRPAWLTDAFLPWLGHADQGGRPGPLAGNVHGGNLGLRRIVLDTVGTFRTDLGPSAIGHGEDTEFGQRARAAGFRPLYAPDALIYHLIPPERATRSAFLRRRYRTGLSQPLFKEYPESTPRMLLSFIRAAFERLASAAFAFSAARRMDQLCRLAEHLGRARQILRMRARG